MVLDLKIGIVSIDSGLYKLNVEKCISAGGKECRANVLTLSQLTWAPISRLTAATATAWSQVYARGPALIDRQRPVLPFARGCTQLRVQESPTAVATVVSPPLAPPGRPRSAGRVREGGGCEEDGGSALPAGEHLLPPSQQRCRGIRHCTSLGGRQRKPLQWGEV